MLFHMFGHVHVDPIRLRTNAETALADAARARALAAELGVRWRLLEDRLGPCLRAHRPDVWNSRAAAASRRMLVGTVAREVDAARQEMHRTWVALERHARQLEARARADLARAAEPARPVPSVVQAAGGS